MNERKYFILAAILKSYLEAKEPLGSRTLKRLYNMDVSAATIRNEMSDLELMGYLEKTHVSSGRVPSQKAYRWYVDSLMERGLPREHVPQLADRRILSQTNDPKDILQTALSLLSDITGMTALVYLPSREQDILEKLRFIPLSNHELFLVMVFGSKFVQTERIHLRGTYPMERFHRSEEILSALLEGKKLSEMNAYFKSGIFSGQYVSGNLMSELIPIIRERLDQQQRARLKFEGLFKLLKRQERSTEEAMALIYKLQNDPGLYDFLPRLQTDRSMQVFIGEENEVKWLRDFSLILVPYRVQGNFIGQLGVIGPVGMDYPVIMRDIARIGRYINSMTLRE